MVTLVPHPAPTPGQRWTQAHPSQSWWPVTVSSTDLRPTPNRANRTADATDAPDAPRHRVPALARALLAYVGVRALGLAVLTLWAHRQHHGVWPILATQWDAEYYLGIADHG